MYDFDKPIWAEMQIRKIHAYREGEIEIAMFWQNEQILKKLTDILFATKEKNVQS